MKEIRLTQGLTALVDDKDYEWLNKFKWFAMESNKGHRVARNNITDKGWRVQYMHRLIMNTPEGMECDHKDHNGLNCQRSNLRNCTHRENGLNRTARGASKYLGVSAKGSKYRATIRLFNKQFYLGSFVTEEDAAKAYDKAASLNFGEFANLNFKG